MQGHLRIIKLSSANAHIKNSSHIMQKKLHSWLYKERVSYAASKQEWWKGNGVK